MEEHIAIIGAMDEEVEALSQALTGKNEVQNPFADLPMWTGKLQGQDVVIVRCGIGKVNAALATQYVIDHFHASFIINSGVAGGVNPAVRIGDLVLGASSMQHDVDVREFGHPKGIIPRLPTSTFHGDAHLLALALDAARLELGKDKVHQGLIVSGDQFISSIEQKQEIVDFFPTALCAEMEGAAIAQVACVNQVPHLIVRAISDQADNTAPEDFNEYLLQIIPILGAVIQRLLSHL